MSHYFTNDYIESNERQFEVIIKGVTLKFKTDNNTFSKKGLDFGTRSLLESLNLNEIKGSILDFGCGWGPIGIYLSKVLNIKIDMCDINERALKLSKKNAEKNKVNVNIFKSDCFENINDNYDYIITNPPIRIGKEKLYNILFSSIKHLNKNGKLYFVINKNQGAKSVIKDLNKNYIVTLIKKNKGFFIICVQNH